MADPQRRGEDGHDSAWAELTWKKLFSFVVKFGLLPGFVSGVILDRIAVHTNWFQVMLSAVAQSMMAMWYLWAGFGLFTFSFFYFHHRLGKSKKTVLK